MLFYTDPLDPTAGKLDPPPRGQTYLIRTSLISGMLLWWKPHKLAILDFHSLYDLFTSGWQTRSYVGDKLHTKEMLIKKYTADWITYFAKLKCEIENALTGLNYTIEHVGSTSVPDLDSKDIIDIDIIYKLASEFEKIKTGLIKLGYFHNGNQGIEYREVFKRTGESTNEILDSIKHHLYVCPIDSVELERHILFRNFLRKNKWARLKYQALKHELASKANQNKKLYAEMKALNLNEFIEEIIKREKRNK